MVNPWDIGPAAEFSGVYYVGHHTHRPAHYAILQRGERFPACRVCGTAVSFLYVQPLTEADEVEHIGYDIDFMDSVLEDCGE
jgi:hypothetical protein